MKEEDDSGVDYSTIRMIVVLVTFTIMTVSVTLMMTSVFVTLTNKDYFQQLSLANVAFPTTDSNNNAEH